MSNQILISSGAKLRDLDDVIIGTDGVLTSLGFNVANGVPKLDENGKILVSQLPNSVMEFKGVWDAATNTPTLANGTGNAGDVYLCNVAGTVNFGAGPIAFAVGDYAVYTGTVWARSSGATGTVTSVGLSRSGDALTVTGSPITTSGTINIGFAGTNLQYINGAGNLVTFPTIAQEAQRLITEVYNETGATLAKGSIVYINGGHGNLPTVTKAIATGDATSAQTYGIVQNDIGNNNNGFVVVIGSLTDLDTQAYPEGTQLYLSGTTAGAWTSTKPYAPVHLVYVAIVTRSHPTQGVVEVSIQNGYEMDELHNVAAQNPDNNDILQYKTSTSLWTKVAGTTSNIAEGSNLYFTDARARQSISLTTTGSTGASTYDNVTGVLNIPNYVDQYVGTVTSVGLSAPTGFSVTGSPVTSSGTLALAFAAGYSLPTNASQANWNTAYNDSIISAAVTGTTTKTLTLNQQDGGTITASWTDYDTAPVTSVFGRTGAVVAAEGDYNLTQLGDVTITSPTTGQVLKYNGTTWINDTDANTGTVTSVAMSVPTGLSVSGSPITSSGTLAVTFTAGYSIPTNASQTNWDTAYTNRITSLTTTGTSGAATLTSNTLNIPQYQAALTNPVTGTGTENYIPKFTTTGSTIGNSAIRNEGIYVSINGPISTTGGLALYNDTQFGIELTNTGTGGTTWQIGPTNNTYGAGGDKFVFTYGASSPNSLLTLIQSTRNVSIGSTTDVSRLYVEGVHTTGRGIITVNSADTAYLHISSSSNDGTEVGVRYAKSNVEKWVLGMVGGTTSDYTFRLLGAGLATNVFNVNLSTGQTTYNYGITVNCSTPTITLNDTADAGIEVALRVNGEDFEIIEPEDTNKVWFKLNDTTEDGYIFGSKVWTAANLAVSGAANRIAFYTTSGTLTTLSYSDYFQWNNTSSVFTVTGPNADVYTAILGKNATIADGDSVRIRFGDGGGGFLGHVGYLRATSSDRGLMLRSMDNIYLEVNQASSTIRALSLATSGAATFSSSVVANGSVQATDSLIATGSDTTGTRVSIFNTSTGGISWNIFSGGSAATLGAVGNLIFRNSTIGATRMSLSPSGVLRLNAYGSGGITGTVTRYLAVDANGDVIETTGGGAGSQWTTTASGIYYTGKTSIGTTQFATNSTLLVGDYINLGTSAIAQFNGFIRVKDQIILHNTSNTALESYIQCQAANSLTTDGNFSIGTLATSSKLTVYQGSGTTTTIDQGIVIGNGSGITGVMAALKFGTYGDTAGSTAYAKQFIAGWRNENGAGFGDLILGNYKGDDGLGIARYEDTALRIKKSGNVIIGAFNTTDIQPTFSTVRLQLNGSFYLSNTTADAGQWINGGTGAWSFIQYSNGGTNKFIEGYRDADALYHIAPGGSLATNSGFNMNSGGRIHIGGNSFTGLLTISGAHPGGFGMLRLISSDACLLDMDSQSYDNRLRLKINGVDTWFVGMVDSTTYKWTDSGNTAKLSLTTAGALTATGGFFDTSDARLKTLIEDNYLLSSIANVKAKLYIKNGKEELGYYAQDLESILPSAVNKGEDGFLNLAYSQVHTAKIAVIEDEVTILKNKVSNLEDKLKKYEA
jgi:hypothetical protein